ncbi:Eukaryotic initiation factor 4A-III, partial [Entomortierella chlamydospora]
MSEANTSTDNGSHTGNPLPNQKQSQQQQEKKNKPASPSVEGTSTEAKANADPNTHSNEGATNSANNTPPTSTSGSALPSNSSNPSSPRTSRSKRNNAAFPPRGGATPKSPSMRGSDNETKPSGDTTSPGSPSVAKVPTAQKDSSDTGSQLNPEAVGTVGLGVISGNDTKTEQSSHQSPQPSRRGGFGKPNGDRPANSSKGGYGNRGESRGGGDDENSRGRRSDRRMNRSDTATATPTDSPTATSANASKLEGDSNSPSTNSNATTSTSGDAKSYQQSESPGVTDVKKTHNATRSPRSPRSPRRGFGERGVDAKNGSPAKGTSPSPRPRKDNVSVESGSYKNEPTDSGAPAPATTSTPSTPSTPSTEPLKKRKPTKKNKRKDDDDVSTVSAGSARDVSTEDKESSRNVRPNDNEAANANAGQPATESQEGVNEGSSATWARKSKPNRNTQQQQRPHGSTDGSNPRSAHKSPPGSYHTFDPNSPRNRKDDASYSNKGNHRNQNSNRNNNNSAESHRPQQGNSSSTETAPESKNWESDEKKPDTQAQSGWGDPPTETTGDGWGETPNLGLKWGEEPPKTSGGGGGWGEPTASPSPSWNEKPAKYNGGKGRGEDPSKSSGGRWGENPAKTSGGGGRGRGRAEEPMKTGGGGWDEKPAKTNGGGWGEKPTKTSGGKWNEKLAKTSGGGGGWGEKPTETGGSGGWGEKPAETGGSRGWGEKPAETSGGGGWGEKPAETSGGGGWGGKPAETSGGGWGEKSAETSGGGWGEKPAETSGGGWGEKPAEASGEGWGKPAETSGGGWGEPPAVPSLKWDQEIPWDTQNSLKPLSDPNWGKGDSGGDNNPGPGGNNGNSNRRLEDARNARLGVQRGPRPGAAKTFSDSASVSSSDVPESTAAVQEPASAATVESRPAKKGAAKSDGTSERREAPFENRRQPTSSTGPSDVRLDPRYNNRQNGPRPGQRGGAFSSQYRQDNHSSSSVSSDVYQNGPPAKGKFDQAGQPRKSPKDKNPKDKVPERYTPLSSDSLECQMTWKDMDLSPSVLACIAKAGLDKPSNVQKLIMKPFKEGRDVIAQAQSQNDRTNTLAIALLQKLSSSASTQKHCQALVICSEGINPQKVHEDFENWFSSTPGLRSILLNADVVAEKTLLSDPEQPKQVILTTLGPLMEAINNNLLDMKAIGTVAISMRSAELVNFEAFKKFWANLSRDAQVVLMTGRIMPQIQMIKAQNFRANAAVRRADELTMQWSEHYYISVPLTEQQTQLESGHGDDAKKDSESAPKDRKWEILMDILTKNPDISHSVILTQSQSVTQALTAKLEAQKLPVLSVWSMADKTEVARQFNRPDPCILVSESVLMDSLDLDYSSLVINYEMPRKASHYISSFGPFGRSGLRTLVINFCATEDAVQKQTLGDMESIYDIKIQEMQ